MATSTPLRIGLLGAAKIAPPAVITPAAGRDDVQISVVGARDPVRAKAYAEEHGIPHVAAGYAELISRDDVDVVYNALPPAAHAEWTIRALEAGKAVLCEKPFCMNAGEARSMVAASEATGRPLIEAFHYRFHAQMLFAFDVIASGRIGKPVRAEAVFQVPIPYRDGELRWIDGQGGGALMDLGTYCVHVLRTVAGSEPKVTGAWTKLDRGVDVETEAELLFDGGLEASLRCAMNPVRLRADLIVEAERGSLIINNFLAPQMGTRLRLIENGVMTAPTFDAPSTYAAQLAHVVDVVTKGAKPLTGGQDCIAQMATLDAIRAKSRGT